VADAWCRAFDAYDKSGGHVPTLIGNAPLDDPGMIEQLVRLHISLHEAEANIGASTCAETLVSRTHLAAVRVPYTAASLVEPPKAPPPRAESPVRFTSPTLVCGEDGSIFACYLPSLLTNVVKVSTTSDVLHCRA
jgi:hypothetical protein